MLNRHIGWRRDARFAFCVWVCASEYFPLLYANCVRHARSLHWPASKQPSGAHNSNSGSRSSVGAERGTRAHACNPVRDAVPTGNADSGATMNFSALYAYIFVIARDWEEGCITRAAAALILLFLLVLIIFIASTSLALLNPSPKLYWWVEGNVFNLLDGPAATTIARAHF